MDYPSLIICNQTVDEADLHRHTCAVLHVHMTTLDILGNNWIAVLVCIVLQEMDKMLDLREK